MKAVLRRDSIRSKTSAVLLYTYIIIYLADCVVLMLVFAVYFAQFFLECMNNIIPLLSNQSHLFKEKGVYTLSTLNT